MKNTQQERTNIHSNQTEISQSQTKIMERQTESMEKQTELIERQIRIEEEKNTVRLALHEWDVDENNVRLILGNFGGVPAQNLYLNIDVVPINNTLSEQFQESDEIKRKPTKETPKHIINADAGCILKNDQLSGGLARTIKPNDTMTVECDYSFSSITYDEPNSNRLPSMDPKEYIEKISEYGNGAFHYEIEIEYDYRDIEDATFFVFGGSISVDTANDIENLNLETLLANTDMIFHPENYVYPILVNEPDDVFGLKPE